MRSDPSPQDGPDLSQLAEPRYRIRLLGTPVRLMAAIRQYHDELMEELSLLATQGPDQSVSVPQRLLELTKVLGRRYGDARGPSDAAIDVALERGARRVDLSYEVSGSVVDVVDCLEELMAEADELGRTERLLILPRSELVVRFAHWFFDEFRRQIAGLPPQPWDGP